MQRKAEESILKNDSGWNANVLRKVLHLRPKHLDTTASKSSQSSKGSLAYRPYRGKKTISIYHEDKERGKANLNEEVVQAESEKPKKGFALQAANWIEPNPCFSSLHRIAASRSIAVAQSRIDASTRVELAVKMKFKR